MDNIRLGNTFEVSWAINQFNGTETVPYDLSGKNLTLILSNARSKVRVEKFSVIGNIISFTFEGKDQECAGRYSLILIENDGIEGMHVVDVCDAFRLVNRSCETCDDPSSIVDCTHIDFTSTMLSRRGISAYEYAKLNGYEGTEEEYAAECLAVPVLNEESRIATAAAQQAAERADEAIEAFGPAIANKADLDNGKIIPSQLPDYIIGQVMYGGLIYDDHTISASSNFISKYGNQTYLSASDASKYSGVYFIASGLYTDRTIVGVPQVSTGDWIISTGESWKKVDNSDAVTSVAGLVGNVNASALAAALADLKDANSLARKSEFKTINGQSLLGGGNIVIEGGGGTIDPELLEGYMPLSRDFSDDFNNDFAR